jgi:hypothetical protein
MCERLFLRYLKVKSTVSPVTVRVNDCEPVSQNKRAPHSTDDATLAIHSKKREAEGSVEKAGMYNFFSRWDASRR